MHNVIIMFWNKSTSLMGRYIGLYYWSKKLLILKERGNISTPYLILFSHYLNLLRIMAWAKERTNRTLECRIDVRRPKIVLQDGTYKI